MRRLAAAAVVWPIALASIPARDGLFDGVIHVWPFLLAGCVVVSLYAWRTAAVIAASVVLAQVIQRSVPDPVLLQFVALAALGFASFYLYAIVGGAVAACASIVYLLAYLGIPWRPAMIFSEIVMVAGMSAGILGGPTGGLREHLALRMAGRSPCRGPLGFAFRPHVDRKEEAG